MMLKLLIFWGTFALVLFGILLTLFQNRRQHLRRTAELDALPPAMPIAAPVGNLARPDADKPLQGTPKLICLGGRLKGHRFPISGIGLSIGRADDNDVMIIDGRVSSHHAWIGVVKGQAILRDYQSLNGTFLNADMDTPVSEVALVAGDTIFFGGHGGDQYRFVLE